MAGSPAAYVLDSFALLAYLEGEPGMPRVRSVLEGAAAQRHTVYLSLINLGEALYITERERGLVEARRTLGGGRPAPSGNRGRFTVDGACGGSYQGPLPDLVRRRLRRCCRSGPRRCRHDRRSRVPAARRRPARRCRVAASTASLMGSPPGASSRPQGPEPRGSGPARSAERIPVAPRRRFSLSSG